MGIRLNGNYYDDKDLTRDYPLRNSCIGYQSWVTESNVTATAKAGFPASALGTPFTYDLWKPSSFPATITVDFGATRTIDYVGLGAHKLAGCKVEVYARKLGAYTQIQEAVLLSDAAAMLLFDAVQTTGLQLVITGWATEASLVLDFADQQYSVAEDTTDPSDAHLGVLFAGECLQMPRSQYGGVTPTPFSKTTEILPSTSEGGQWLGRSVVRKGYAASHTWQHLDPQWMRTTFLPFIDHATTGTGTFFLSWRPEGYADEVVYCWTDKDINPSNMGVAGYMQVTLEVKGNG